MINKDLVRAYAARLSALRGGTKVTRREAEVEIGDAVVRVARGLSRRFAFGYHTREDIEQDCVVFALELLAEDPPKYDASRPLDNFLHVHVRNQLSNMKRKQYIRSERPCECCDPFDPPESPCRRWHEWHRRNMLKQNIMRPIDMDRVYQRPYGSGESNLSVPADAEEAAVVGETIARIDAELPVELRGDYLRMRAGENVPKARRQRVREAVAEIIVGGDEGGREGRGVE